MSMRFGLWDDMDKVDEIHCASLGVGEKISAGARFCTYRIYRRGPQVLAEIVDAFGTGEDALKGRDADRTERRIKAGIIHDRGAGEIEELVAL
jgi:hypothetical protein